MTVRATVLQYWASVTWQAWFSKAGAYLPVGIHAIAVLVGKVAQHQPHLLHQRRIAGHQRDRRDNGHRDKLLDAASQATVGLSGPLQGSAKNSQNLEPTQCKF